MIRFSRPTDDGEDHGCDFGCAVFDGEKEAKLIALACSKPPKGRARWTLRLLENKVVELNIVERASDSTIGRTLKKTLSSPTADSAGSSRRRLTARS